MPVLAVAFCPGPPILVPEAAAGAASELDALRSACDHAVLALCQVAPDRIVVVGRSDRVGLEDVVGHASGAIGDLRGYGVDRSVTLGADDGTTVATLPLSLTIGAWLLRRSGWTGPVAGMELPAGLSPDPAAEIGASLGDLPERVALLVVGDGSARLSTAAPGSLHPQARAWQDDVIGALIEGDVCALRELRTDRARVQLASGREAWQVAAGAWTDGPALAASSFVEERYGVGYVVSVWRRP